MIYECANCSGGCVFRAFDDLLRRPSTCPVYNCERSPDWKEAAQSEISPATTHNKLQVEIAAIAHDMEADSKKICGIEIDYYLGRLRQLSTMR